MKNLSKNEIGPLPRKTRLFGMLLLSIGLIMSLSYCEKENDDDDDLPTFTRGTDSYDIADATPQDYLEGLVTSTSNGEIFGAYGLIPAGQWFLDVPHSAVNWKSAYMGSAAMLTGKFSWFAVNKFTFHEQDPSKISFVAKVLLNSVDTGQHLRDDGCLLATFATDGTMLDEAANLATLTSTSTSLNLTDAGYTVLADLTFLGVTHAVTINLDYLGFFDYETYSMISFAAEFQFNAITDYALSTTLVSDLVTINLNLNFKKNK